MRNNLALLISLVFLTACGGGGSGGSSGSTGTTIPVGSVSGTSFDGLIINGTVSVYDFTTGAKGSLLGQTTSDGNGLYSLSLQVESRPVLLEINGGYYNEEAGSTTSTQVSLSTNQKLTALANYTTGTPLKVAVTTYTHLAAGLAAFEISKDTAVSTAINDANTRASSLAGVNILTTTPKEITDVSNASATLSPELKYGFLAGAISMWTYNNAPTAAVAHLPPYTSIDFAQLLYQDISADGLLDGIGLDSTGAAAPLSFGTTLLGVDVYRKELGVAMVQIARDANNKTGLDAAIVLPFAQSYVSSTDPMFNNIVPIPIIAPVVTITGPAANSWARKNISVTGNINSSVGLKMAELIVDGISVATASNLTSPAFSLNTANYADGTHTLSVRATDYAGLVTTSNIPVKIDNTVPSSTGYLIGGYSYTEYTIGGIAIDNYSGVPSVVMQTTFSGYGYGIVSEVPLAIDTSGNWSARPSVSFSPSTLKIKITDAAGNCSAYGYVLISTWAWTAKGVCP
jgi:hypothetical protein